MTDLYDVENRTLEQKKSRSLTLNLTDTDTNLIRRTAAKAGFSVGELLENFIADLVDGRGTNGSDEREMAQAWYERCWFGMFPEETFLHYAISEASIPLEDIIESYEEIKECKRNIAHTRKEIEQGGIIRGTSVYHWNQIVDSDGNQSYATLEEWISLEKEYIEQEQDQAGDLTEQLQDEWNDFLNWTDKTDLIFEEELEKLIKWKEESEKELQPEEGKIKYKAPDIPISR